jgi:hypothetical protein
MKIQHRISFFLLLEAGAATACLERIDSGATKGLSGIAPSPGAGGSDTPSGTGGSNAPRGTGGSTPRGTGGSGPSSQGGSAGAMPDAGHVEEDAETPEPPPKPLTTSLATPEIEFVTPEGDPATTVVPCEATIAQATTILTQNCAPCHGGRNVGERQGQPPFDYVLDFDKLLAAVSSSVPDPLAPPANRIPGTPNFQGMRFLIPGDPDHSRLYFRMVHKEMPPLPIENMPDTVKSRPTVSDFSVMRQWMLDCIEAPPDEEPDGGAGRDDAGAGDDADPGDPDNGDAAANTARR